MSLFEHHADPCLAIDKALTEEQRRTLLDAFCKANPNWRGAHVADVLDELGNTDSHLSIVEPMFEHLDRRQRRRPSLVGRSGSRRVGPRGQLHRAGKDEMNFVGLSKGTIQISFGDDKYTFNPDEHVRIGDLIAKHQAWSFMTSSSCNHPHEYGFGKNFDVDKVLAKAVEHARSKVAIAVPRGPIGDAAERIEQLVREAKVSLPVSLNFIGSGKKGQDVVVTFTEENDFEFFLAGIRYAARLAACTNGAACTNESSSERPSSATPVKRPRTTSASRPTTTGKASRSTAGNAKGAARSARTKKAGSRSTRSARGG